LDIVEMRLRPPDYIENGGRLSDTPTRYFSTSKHVSTSKHAKSTCHRGLFLAFETCSPQPKSIFTRLAYRSFASQNQIDRGALDTTVPPCKSALTAFPLNCRSQQFQNILLVKYRATRPMRLPTTLGFRFNAADMPLIPAEKIVATASISIMKSELLAVPSRLATP
jgi:hypothetical protein